jgi:hypothetical protein
MELLGPTAVPTIILLIFGFVMLIIEMFHPGIGAAGFLGVLSLIAVAVLQFGWGNTRVALYIVAITLLVIILGINLAHPLHAARQTLQVLLVLRESSDGASVPEVASASRISLAKPASPSRASSLRHCGDRRPPRGRAGRGRVPRKGTRCAL